MDLSRQNGITTTSELAFGAINLPLEQAVFERDLQRPVKPDAVRCRDRRNSHEGREG